MKRKILSEHFLPAWRALSVPPGTKDWPLCWHKLKFLGLTAALLFFVCALHPQHTRKDGYGAVQIKAAVIGNRFLKSGSGMWQCLQQRAKSQAAAARGAEMLCAVVAQGDLLSHCSKCDPGKENFPPDRIQTKGTPIFAVFGHRVRFCLLLEVLLGGKVGCFQSYLKALFSSWK